SLTRGRGSPPRALPCIPTQRGDLACAAFQTTYGPRLTRAWLSPLSEEVTPAYGPPPRVGLVFSCTGIVRRTSASQGRLDHRPDHITHRLRRFQERRQVRSEERRVGKDCR